jgi:hypothetical protein
LKAEAVALRVVQFLHIDLLLVNGFDTHLDSGIETFLGQGKSQKNIQRSPRETRDWIGKTDLDRAES